MPKLYSYTVARDYGFAPNPFYGVCTLAACKSKIRSAAQVGDWIVGTGAKAKGRDGRLVYAMRVSETMSFDAYWSDPRFLRKRPDMYGSRKMAYGDNIYHRDSVSGQWRQADSHHSRLRGKQNCRNMDDDTKVDRVLVSDDFIYLGGAGPIIPTFRGVNICHQWQGHRSNFPEEVVTEFVEWVRSLGDWGYCGAPLEWSKPVPRLPPREAC